MRTTVLATERPMPNTRPAVARPAERVARPPSRGRVATTLCTIAPGTATRQTATSSSMWNCSPTPNISRMMPTSASCSAMWRSATKPGRVRADEEPGDQVADDGREADAMGRETEDQRRAETAGQRQDQIEECIPDSSSRR